MESEPARADDVHGEIERAQQEKPWQRYLEAALGLRHYWYPVLFSHELKEGETCAETILGERLFLKRINGHVSCVADRCLHRGVPFSVRPECYTEHTLTCWFHGFTYDWRDGRLVEILSEADSALIGKVGLQSYPTFERHQVIFVWIGDGEPLHIHAATQPRFWDDHLVTSPVLRYKITCTWRVAAENGFDAAHIYGHRHWVGMQQSGRIRPFGTSPSRKDIVQVREADGQPKGIVKQDDINVYARQIEGREGRVPLWPQDAPAVVQTDPRAGWVGCYLPSGLQVEGFPTPGKVHFEWYIPLDEPHHDSMILHAGYARTEAERDTFYQEAETLAKLIWQEPGVAPEGCNNFDAFARQWSHHAYAKEDWWHRERLFTPDYSIILWRMVVSRQVRGIQRRGNWAPMEDDEESTEAAEDRRARRGDKHTGAAECNRAERAKPFADSDLNHDSRVSEASHHSRMRSNRKVRSASLTWPCASTEATPWTSSTTQGVIMRGVGRCPPCSYTIVMAPCSNIAVENASKPEGGSTV